MTVPKIVLKGGIAFNLFDLDMPRLSVYIGFCYLPIRSREESLKTFFNIVSFKSIMVMAQTS
jgi:hypothetical protein